MPSTRAPRSSISNLRSFCLTSGKCLAAYEDAKTRPWRKGHGGRGSVSTRPTWCAVVAASGKGPLRKATYLEDLFGLAWIGRTPRVHRGTRHRNAVSGSPAPIFNPLPAPAVSRFLKIPSIRCFIAGTVSSRRHPRENESLCSILERGCPERRSGSGRAVADGLRREPRQPFCQPAFSARAVELVFCVVHTGEL